MAPEANVLFKRVLKVLVCWSKILKNRHRWGDGWPCASCRGLAWTFRSILFCHQLLLSLVNAAQLNVTDAQDGRRACSATLSKHSLHCNNNGTIVFQLVICRPLDSKRAKWIFIKMFLEPSFVPHFFLQNQLLAVTAEGWYVGEGKVNANTALLRPV